MQKQGVPSIGELILQEMDTGGGALGGESEVGSALGRRQMQGLTLPRLQLVGGARKLI